MPLITDIKPQVKDKTRCNLEVDGRFYCGLSLETVMRYRLKAGTEIAEEELARLQTDSEKTAALDKALKHISVSMKTERELRDYLVRKGYLPEVCDYVMEKMKSYGYLDDGVYAAAYAEHAGKTKGKRLIAAELKRKGISQEDAEHALSEVGDETPSAVRVLEKYLRGKQADAKTLRKGYAYLIGKGFDYDTARAALERLGETEDEI